MINWPDVALLYNFFQHTNWLGVIQTASAIELKAKTAKQTLKLATTGKL